MRPRATISGWPLALGLGALAVGAGLAGWAAWGGVESGPPLAPYLLPIVAGEGDAGLAFAEERVARLPESGLDWVALAGAAWGSARRGGGPLALARARDAARRALELLPGNAEALVVLAELAQETHAFAEARALALEALRGSPRHVGARTVLLKVALACGETSLADDMSAVLVAELPTQGAWILRGLAHEACGRDEAARAAWEASFRIEQPGALEASTWARALYARHLYERGALEQAAEVATEALRLAPRDPQALLLAAQSEVRLSGPGPALERLLSAGPSLSREPALLVPLAEACLAAGERARAQELLARAETVVREDLGEFDHPALLARLLLLRGEPRGQAEALRLARAEALRRRDARTLEVYARALVAGGQITEADAVVDEALSSGVQLPGLWRLGARVAALSGREQLASLRRARARDLDPTLFL